MRTACAQACDGQRQDKVLEVVRSPSGWKAESGGGGVRKLAGGALLALELPHAHYSKHPISPLAQAA